MTLQQYFDATVAHLAEQKCRAHDGNRCQYLTDDGLRCAIGCHIPDGHPAQKEDMTFDTLSRKYPDLAGIAWVDSEQGHLLAEHLQLAHDNSLSLAELRAALITEAVELGLDYSSVDQITEWEGVIA